MIKKITRLYGYSHHCILLMIMAGVVHLSGCATTQNRNIKHTDDKLESFNRVSFQQTEFIDKSILVPIARGYKRYIPRIPRMGVTNFFDNLSSIDVIIHAFLQGKFKQSLADAGRFVTNSTLGFGGLFDVATNLGLERHKEDFGKTLATWGVTAGPYIYVPLLGPYKTRHMSDIPSNILLSPLRLFASNIFFPLSVFNAINTRANLLSATDFIDDAALDRYSFTREAYLQRREYQLYDGNLPVEKDTFDFDFDDNDDSQLYIE